MQLTRDCYSLTDDTSQFDIDAIIALLQTTYWATDRTREQVDLSLRHSVCVGLFHQSRLVWRERSPTVAHTPGFAMSLSISTIAAKVLGVGCLRNFLSTPALCPR